MVNGLGAYEAGSSVLDKLLVWGVPYLLGRLYFAGVRSSRRLVEAIFVGGLIYVPLCLWEIRMSPQLHVDVYGFHQHSFTQSYRAGGFRPTVFMHHGLMVGLWMTAASLAGLWLWRRGRLREISGVPMVWALGALLVTSVLCKSTGALALLAVGVGVLLLEGGARARAALAILLLLPLAYVGTRATQTWSGDDLVAIVSKFAPRDRVQSLEYRMTNEDLIVASALRWPIAGAGRFGRWLPKNEDGGDLAVPDQLWVIAMGENGFVGLASLLAMLLLPVARLVWRIRSRDWKRPEAAPAVALAMIVTVFTIDCLFNAMVNPVYIVAAGALAGFDASPGALREARRRSAVRAGDPSPAAVALAGNAS
jgi:O-antigen ligase